jgi:hypothetical protein
LRTISAAAARAQAGHVITVHEGIYRERITPPRGGTSDANRIVYQPAPGERVVISGAEVINGWVKLQGDIRGAVRFVPGLSHRTAYFTEGLSSAFRSPSAY